MKLPVALIALSLGLASTSVASAAPVVIPAGTPVSVTLDAPLSSGTAAVGQTFAVSTADPVIVGTTVVIPKGAHGAGVVKKVSKARKKSAGEMTLTFSYVIAPDGTKVVLSEVDHSVSGSANKGKAGTATVVATLALGPVGLFAHNLVKGKDITIESTQKLPAYVDANTKVTVK